MRIGFRGKTPCSANWADLKIARQRLGVRQSSGAFEVAMVTGKAPENWRSPRPGGQFTALRPGLSRFEPELLMWQRFVFGEVLMD